MKKNSGFSIVELLVALAIVGILFAVVIPSYQNQTGDVSRADQCIKPMAEIQGKLTRWKGRAPAYTTDLVGDLGYSSTQSPAGTHTYQILAQNAQGTACDIRRCYAIHCIPNNPATDVECGTMILDYVGRKNISGAGTVNACWGL